MTGRGSLAPRLLGAFVAVALLGIAVLALLVAGGLQAGSQRLAESARLQTAQDVADAAAAAYADAGSWNSADLAPAAALAAESGASLVVRNSRGAPVAAYSTEGQPLSRPGGGQGMMGGPPVTAAVVAEGTEVGAVALRFPTVRAISDRALATLWLWIALAAAAALVVAVAAALLVTRRITGPLRHLSDAVARIGRGERDMVLHPADFPGELGTVADAVTVLARDLDTGERLRRAALADVTHELRTPVAVLQAYLEEMVDGMAAASPDRLAMLHDEVLRIGRLISDLEVLREAESSGLSLQSELVDLAVVAARAADVLSGPAAEHGVTFERRLDQAPAIGDPARLMQVVLNLLTNALKHGGGTGVSIRTATKPGVAVLEVSDNGPGIAAQDLPHIFDRYWRGGTGAAGSGVGLTVVREIVTAHSGTVEASSGPGGTTFRVELPR